MSGTCDGCRFWTQQHDGAYPLGACDCPKFIRGYGDFDLAIILDGVRVEDDEGWGFYTGPKFGCVHWEKLNAEKAD